MIDISFNVSFKEGSIKLKRIISNIVAIKIPIAAEIKYVVNDSLKGYLPFSCFFVLVNKTIAMTVNITTFRNVIHPDKNN